MSDVELLKQSVEAMLLLRLGELRRLKDRGDVLRDGELAKDGRLLREVADAERGAPVHGIIRDADVGEIDVAVRGLLKPHDHIERRRLARAVGSQEPDDLPFVHANGDAVDDRAAAEFLDEVSGFEMQDAALPTPSQAYRRPRDRRSYDCCARYCSPA